MFSSDGDKGTTAVVSCIVATIFSSWIGLRCFDFERELEHSSCGGDLDRGLDRAGIDLEALRLSLEDHELDNEGT
jgi:hypothetical protein